MTGRRRHRVRKMFTDASTGGSDTAYWESTWDALDLESEKNQILTGPVATRLHSYLDTSGGLVLEAGCGTGAVAVALGTMGHWVIGLDLAEQTLRRARRTWADFSGAAGDVRTMPFPDETFDAVISLGVLEHDEAGPQGALREHRRVLRAGGVLLVTVPRISPLKAMRDIWNLTVMGHGGYESRGRWAVRRDDMFTEDGDRTFHQYEFRRSHWQSLVREAGFEILDSRPLGVGAGLGDLTLARGNRDGTDIPTDRASKRGHAPRSENATAEPSRPGAREIRAFPGRAKTVVTSETASNRVESALVSASQYGLGHMDLTVARRI